MKTGRTIQEMAVEIMRQSKAKEDYLVNTGSLVMEVWNGQPMLHLRDAGGSELVDPLDIQSTAHQQIGDYLEIPRKYYRRMLGEDAELLGREATLTAVTVLVHHRVENLLCEALGLHVRPLSRDLACHHYSKL